MAWKIFKSRGLSGRTVKGFTANKIQYGAHIDSQFLKLDAVDGPGSQRVIVIATGRL